jgi:hypothetical protein
MIFDFTSDVNNSIVLQDQFLDHFFAGPLSGFFYLIG